MLVGPDDEPRIRRNFLKHHGHRGADDLSDWKSGGYPRDGGGWSGRSIYYHHMFQHISIFDLI